MDKDKQRMPWGFRLLLVFLVLSLLRGVSELVTYSSSSDFIALNQYNIGFFYFLFMIPLIIINGFLIYYYIKKKKIGYKLSMAYFGLTIIFSTLLLILSSLNFEDIMGSAIDLRLERDNTLRRDFGMEERDSKVK